MPRNLRGELANAVLENHPDAVVGIARDGKILLFNQAACRLFQLEEKAVRDLKIWEVPQTQKLLKDLPLILRDEKSSYKEEIVALARDKFYLLQIYRVEVENKIIGALGILRDLSEVYRIEQEVNQFVANVSHELKAPLTSIKGYIETLLEGTMKDTDVCQRFLQIINEETNRMARLIIDLLQVSSFPEKGGMLALEPLDLAQLIQEITQPFMELVKRKNLSVKIDLPPQLPLILADRDRLLQVLVNLIDNAIKFTGIKGEGEITISAQAKEEMIEVKIADSGIGIPAQEQEKIFERFYRIKEGPGALLGGTGLGLSIVKQIINAHGGEIGVESQKGRGSVFFFTIPGLKEHKDMENKHA